MKWLLWILLILTLCAIVAGVAVLVTVAFMPRAGPVGQLPAVTVQLATFTPRPTLVAKATRTATRVAKAAPAFTASPSALPATAAAVATSSALPPTPLPAATSTPPPATATPVAREMATRTATAVPTVAATSVLTPTEMATVAPTKAPTMVPTKAPTGAAKAAATLAPTKAATAAPTRAPTKTARPTRTATAYPIRAGWTDHAAADFRLALPERWKAIDVTEEGIEAVLEAVEELDSDWADRIREMYSTEDLQQIIKFWAMDTKAVGDTYANVNVGAQEVPESITLTEVVKQISAGFKQAGGQVIASSYRARINGLDAARLTLRMRVGSVTVQEYTYLYKRGNKMWVVTYAVDQKYWNTYMNTFDASARSFRAD